VIRAKRGRDQLLSLPDVLRLLRDMGLERVMVEGGQEVIGSLLAHRLVDECVITIAPRFAGGVPAVGGRLPAPLPSLENVTVQLLGGDLVIRGRIYGG